MNTFFDNPISTDSLFSNNAVQNISTEKIDSKSMNLEDFMNSVTLSRSEVMDEQLRTKGDQMKQNNSNLAKINDLKNRLLAAQSNVKEGDDTANTDVNIPVSPDDAKLLQQFVPENKSLSTGNITSADADSLLKQLDNKASSYQTTAQQDMTELNDAYQKFNQCLTLIANINSAKAQTISGIISKMG